MTGYDYGASIVGFLAITVVYFVNWRLTYTSRWRLRLIIAASVTLAAIAVTIIPYSLLGLWFHLRIGDKL